METINALIIDDEKHCRESLSELIRNKFPEIRLAEICSNPAEGIIAISKLEPDLVFLDVEMPGMTGFEMLKKLPEITFEVIFTTAFDKYAVRAIKASALDFLLKPVTYEDLVEAIAKFRNRFRKEKPYRQLEVLYDNLQQKFDPLKKLAIPSQNGLEIIPVREIIRLEGDSNYTTFHLRNQAKFLVSKTLKGYEELLADQHFFRIHQSHVINLKCVKRYIKGEGGIAVMEDGSELDVSRRRKDEFVKALQHI